MWRLVPAAVALVLAGGCTSLNGPPVPDPAAALLPPAPDHPAPPALTWSEIGRPALAVLVRQALARNTDVEAALARVQAARAAAREAGAARLPQANARAEGGLQGQGVGDGRRTAGNLLLAVDASYEVDLWGRLRSGALAARRDARASALELEAVRVTVAGDVADAWFDLAQNGALLALFEQSISNARRSDAIVRARVRAGDAAAADAARSRADLLRLEERRHGLQAERDRIAYRLAVLLGDSPASFAPPEAPAAALDLRIGSPRPSLASLRSRPDVLASEARLDASGLRVREARAAFYPALTLSAGASSAASTLGSLLQPQRIAWSLAAAGIQTLFDGGARRARVEGREAEQLLALAEHRRVLLTAIQEVETALTDLRGADAQLALEEERLVAQDRVVRAARSRLREGGGSVADLLRDEAQLLADREQLVTLQRARAAAAVGLLKAIGVSPAVDDPTPSSGLAPHRSSAPPPGGGAG